MRMDIFENVVLRVNRIECAPRSTTTWDSALQRQGAVPKLKCWPSMLAQSRLV